MIRRSVPPGVPVVGGSTPVVSFGDPGRAEVATLGINPSKAEFIENGVLLSGSSRRLATLESLGASDVAQLTDEQVLQVARLRQLLQARSKPVLSLVRSDRPPSS